MTCEDCKHNRNVYFELFNESVERNIKGYPQSDNCRRDETGTVHRKLEETTKGGKEMSEEFENVEIEDTSEYIVGSEHRVSSFQELLNCLYDADVKYQFWKNVYEQTEADLWLNTNWDEVFPDKKPTVKDKEMFIKQELQEAKELRDTCKMEYEDFKRMFEVSMKYGLECLG